MNEQHSAGSSKSRAECSPDELREFLGKLVRMEWIAWAKEQPSPKASWLQSWDELTDPEREVDRRIGERIHSFSTIRHSDSTQSVHLSSGGKPDEPIYTRADVGHMLGVIRALEAHKAGSKPPGNETFDGVSAEEHERYKRCLYRANGRLILLGQEPEKLDYSDRHAPETKSVGCPHCGGGVRYEHEPHCPTQKAFVQLCAPHGKDWLTCPECAKAAVNGDAQV